jgi:hypothetical protein
MSVAAIVEDELAAVGGDAIRPFGKTVVELADR